VAFLELISLGWIFVKMGFMLTQLNSRDRRIGAEAERADEGKGEARDSLIMERATLQHTPLSVCDSSRDLRYMIAHPM
jgi:hypothetical protein